MKKSIFLIAVFLLAAVMSQAQTEKGTQTLGLNAYFEYSKTNVVNINPYDNSVNSQNNKSTGFNIGPVYSYFIADKLDIGGSLSYGKAIIPIRSILVICKNNPIILTVAQFT